MQGFTYSDWFAGDTMEGEDPALAVGLVNFLLQATGIDLQLSIANDPRRSEADLLSDWFAGWANAAKTRAVDDDLTTRFGRLIDRQPTKIDWNYFACHYTVNVKEG